MPVSNKHSNSQRVFYSGFDGGLNLSVPNESVPKNELKEAVNVEFSPLTGSMKVRGGLVWSGNIGSTPYGIVPVHGRKGFLMRNVANMDAIYFRWNNIWPVEGTLSGAYPLSIAHWMCVDNNVGGSEIDCWLVASGGRLQKFMDNIVPELTTINNSPANCKLVFVRENRVGVVTRDDRIIFSVLGDCEDWTEDDTTDDSAKWLDVGYKDGMKIDAVLPLSKDLIIFKSPEGEPDKGTIYRLTGEYPDWQVVEVAHNTGTFSQQSVCAVNNDIIYATVAGIATLSTVTQYGEVKTAWPDRKVSNALTHELSSTARLFNVPVKQQVWVIPKISSKKIWIYDYARGIWTTFEFPALIDYVAGVDNQLFLFIGKDVYEVIDGYTYDEMRNLMTNTLEQKTITGKMKLGTILSGMQTLIKAAFASFELKIGCSSELRLGKWKMPFAFGGTEEYIYDPPNDTQSASEDEDMLIPQGGVLTSRRRCIVRDWAITPEIVINGGGCAVSTIGLEIAEV